MSDQLRGDQERRGRAMEGEKRPAAAEAPEVAGGERRRVFREWKGRRDMVKWKSVG